jgi:ribonuclease HII
LRWLTAVTLVKPAREYCPGVAAGRVPNLKLERRRLEAGHVVIAGSDEVGRGALGGPVSTGVVVVDASTGRQPRGLRDSKLLTPEEREALVPRIERWAVAWGVGHASASEIDQIGILRALRLAGERALAQLPELPELVILDGNYDWFRRPARCEAGIGHPTARQVELKIKADLHCSSVAAASVLAKVARDQMMREMSVDYPDYGWFDNKGYATPLHMEALRTLGPCAEHRLSWRLGGEQRLFSPEELDDVSIDELPAGDLVALGALYPAESSTAASEQL